MTRPLAIMPRRGLLKISESAGPGELLIRPIDFPAQMRNGLALLALERGPEAFLRGAGEIEVILVQEEPGLDDMLAAEMVRARLQGLSLPEGLRAVAQYAGTWREGVIPDRESVPIEQSLALTYHVIFSNADDSAGRFCWNEFIVGWNRLSAAIWRGAEQGLDPSADAILEKNPDFTRERSYLREDRETYRLDVQCAERWMMRFPGVPGDSSALILRNPKSSVWFRLAWTDPDSPSGRGYLLVGVEKDSQPDCTNDGKRGTSWRFMTHRTRKLSLKALAASLQQAEVEVAADLAPDDPWYDGHRHGHTLIGSPWCGSQLPRDRVLEIVRTWTGAVLPVREPVPERPRRKWTRNVLILLSAAILIATGIIVWDPEPDVSTEPALDTPATTGLSPVVPPTENDDGRSGSPRSGGADLPWTEQVDYETENFSEVSAPVSWADFDDSHSEEADPPSLKDLMNRRLFILSIGISDYRDPGITDLPGAAEDAEKLMDGFAARSGHFGLGVRTRLILNEKATSRGILSGLNWLRGQSPGARPELPSGKDLVLITVACHAEKIDDRFFLLPHDCDKGSIESLKLSAFDWQNFKDVFDDLQCKFVVILDTCHAGLADLNRSGERKLDFDFLATDVLLRLDGAPPGVVLLQACNGNEQAGGDEYHGRFSKALLSALSRIQTRDLNQNEFSVLDVEELFQLARVQVVQISNGAQNPQKHVYPRDLNPNEIPAASSWPKPTVLEGRGVPITPIDEETQASGEQ
jgi:hypothetical protein